MAVGTEKGRRRNTKRMYVCVTSHSIVMPSCALLHRCGKTSDFKLTNFPFFFFVKIYDGRRSPRTRASVAQRPECMRETCVLHAYICTYTYIPSYYVGVIMLRAGNNDAPADRRYNRVPGENR